MTMAYSPWSSKNLIVTMAIAHIQLWLGTGGFKREREGEDLEGDEELMMGQVQRSLVCPLTQKELENPVKNTACGHVYSKEGKDNILFIYIYF